MMGVLKNFDKLELEEMRFEVALFQAISISNYANEVKTIAQNKGTRIINSVSGFMNSKGINAKSVDEVRVETVEELVAEKCDELKYAIREELHEEMVKALKERLVALNVPEEKLQTEDEIALYTVVEAENGIPHGIGRDASMAQKADHVAAQFAKKQIKELKGNISRSRQDRDLLAHFIWKVSVHNDPYFPEGLSEAPGEAELDTELRGILRDKTNYAQKEKDLNISVTNFENKILGAKASVADLESKLALVDARLEEFMAKGESGAADAEGARKVKDITESEIKIKKDDLGSYEEKLKMLEADKMALKEEKEAKEVRESELVSKISAIVREKWSDKLLGICVTDGALEHLLRTYSLKDRKVLEAALIELGSASDPVLLAEGVRAKDKDVFSFVINERAIGRVLFQDENGILEVEDVLKIKRT